MGGVPCAAKIILCSPPVAQRVSGLMAQAKAVAESVLEYGSVVSDDNLSALQQAVCRCEAHAEAMEKELRAILQACMNDVYLCEATTKAT